MLLSVLQSRFIMQKVKIKKGCRTPQPLQALLQDIIAWENCQGFIKLFERPGRQSWSRPEGRINVVSRASLCWFIIPASHISFWAQKYQPSAAELSVCCARI